MNSWRAFVGLISKSVIGRARAARKRWRVRQARRLFRLQENDFRSLLENPPPADSAQTQAELAEIRQLRQTLTPAEIEQVVREALVSPDLFAQVLGPKFNARDLPRTFAFMWRLMHADGGVVEPIKYFYARKRPYEIDASVRPNVPLDETPAYPSGHTARLLILARTLSEIFPGQGDSLLQLARQIPARRVKVGLHFPTDIKAGTLLGNAIFEKMAKSAAFRSRLNKAQRECRRLHRPFA